MALENPMVVAWGLEALEIADLGKIATAEWEQIGYTLEGSVSVNFDAPTANEVRVEELSVAVLTKYEEGAKSIELDIPNVSADMLAKLMGGTTTGKLTSLPDTTPVLKKMVKFKFRQGGALYFTNANLVAGFGGGMSKTGADTFNIHLTISPNAAIGGTDYETAGMIIEGEDEDETES